MAKVWTIDCGEGETGRARQHILMALADHANDEGYCYPSSAYVAWKTGYSEKQVKRIEADLVNEGIIRIAQDYTPTTPRVYQLKLDKVKSKPAYQRKPSGRGDIYDTPRKSGETSSATRGDIDDSRGDIGQARGDTAMSTEPSLEPSIKPSENQKDAPPEAKAVDPIDSPKAYARSCVLEAMRQKELNGDGAKFERLWERCNQMDLYRRARDAFITKPKPATFRQFETQIDYMVARRKAGTSVF